MLSTSDIIDLYDRQEYDIIIDNLKINSNYSKPQTILLYAISRSNIELFTHTITVNNLSKSIISEIMGRKLLHEKFKYMIEYDCVLHDAIKDIINSTTIGIWDDYYCNIIKYILGINYCKLVDFLRNAIIYNDLDTIDNLFIYGLDIKLAFDQIIELISINRISKIYVSTFIYLEKYNIDITPHINIISTGYCSNNDLDGIIFCLKYGADINYLLNVSVEYRGTTLPTIKYLIEMGAETKYLNVIEHTCRLDLNIVAYLVDFGFDITNYLERFIFKAIYTGDVYHFKYFLNYYNGIYYELFLFYATECCQIDIVELLLNYGNNNTILLFSRSKLKKEIKKIIPDYRHYFFFQFPNFDKKIHMFKFLIKSGIMITDPVKTMQKYLLYTYIYIDEEFLEYMLDAGFNLNNPQIYTAIEYNTKLKPVSLSTKWKVTRKFASILEYFIYYGQIDEITLFLKYNMDVTYNAIKLAINCERENELDSKYSEIVQKLLSTATSGPELDEIIEKYNAKINIDFEFDFGTETIY